ncbi:MSCRAMM family protein [Paramaledivibacter caminithermalis]|uniref:Carboxypeptidase regulatory-like domain-containing protein n=1 Tax=Paramaledivibacter caminithermalis (strain DSM 15212 / CIP 107654 / DViRD3) TaxID=1121301 RepID=A0A1M6JWS9_PARC5|nr:carboxypeptidase-like regulatory domain-containing protein [Paramaledivibacter caminithermalis]SHJ51121.1 hypothetical protein SAMN02745912_00197 [Paramaledivibacter caminithermalis DSM 15212]
MDKYILGQSRIGRITDEHCKIVLNVELEKNVYYNNALIYGNIMNEDRKPIEDAVICFLNENNEEIGSIYSSKEGFYAYFGIKMNTRVRIVVKKRGYKTKTSNFIKICSRMININVYLKELSMFRYALISGHLVDDDSNPLEGITIYLLRRFCNNKMKVYKVTNTNNYGQFVFIDLKKGIYEIFINDPKFEIYNGFIEIGQTHKIFDINIKLKRNIKTKIIGQVKDEDNKPIPNAVVILYRVTNDNKYIPVTYSVCDKEGRYCFTDILFDNYIVRAIP